MLILELLKLNETLNPFTDRTTIPNLDDLFDKPHLADYFKTNKDFVSWEIEYMSPDEYINRVLDANHGITRDQLLGSRLGSGYVDKYAEAMKNGAKFPIPSLEYRGTRLGQEGLHRALAAKKLGIDSIPVMVVHKK